MALYPDDIDTFRTIENLPGLTYNPDDTKTLFVEDLQALQSSVQAIENTLGTSPLWDYSALGSALEEITGRIDYLETYAIPLGVFVPFGGTTAPLNFLICDGAAISRTTYADLFAIIGTAYGAGNGTTTFNIPDMREYVPVGYKSGSTEFGTLGAAYGAKTHTLTSGEMPSHTHTNNLQVNANVGNVANGQTNLDDFPGSAGPISATNVQVGGMTGGINNTGGGGAHNNIQPSRVVNYIIRATS